MRSIRDKENLCLYGLPTGPSWWRRQRRMCHRRCRSRRWASTSAATDSHSSQCTQSSVGIKFAARAGRQREFRGGHRRGATCNRTSMAASRAPPRWWCMRPAAREQQLRGVEISVTSNRADFF